MTKERLIEILQQHGGHESQDWVIEAMTVAVNESIQECADNIKAWKESRFPSVHYCECYVVIDMTTILTLKIQ